MCAEPVDQFGDERSVESGARCLNINIIGRPQAKFSELDGSFPENFRYSGLKWLFLFACSHIAGTSGNYADLSETRREENPFQTLLNAFGEKDGSKTIPQSKKRCIFHLRH